MSIQDEIVQVLFDHNIIPQYLIRDKNIRNDFAELVNKGAMAKDAKKYLAAKYYMSESNISRIVYEKRKYFFYEKPMPGRKIK